MRCHCVVSSLPKSAESAKMEVRTSFVAVRVLVLNQANFKH